MERTWRRRLWWTLAAAFIVWNAIFDTIVNRGVDNYLARHGLHARGQGPAVTIHGVMDAAVSDGLWLASAGAAAVLVGGAGLAWRARKRAAAAGPPPARPGA